MSIFYRRYELLIPLLFNDGSPVPESAIAETLLELRTQFGAVSAETQIIRGHWEFQGKFSETSILEFLSMLKTRKPIAIFSLVSK